MVSKIGDPLLPSQMSSDGFNDFDVASLPPPVEEARWKKWGLRLGSAAAAGGCLAARILNISRPLNAFASFGTGFFTQSAIEAGFKGKNLLQIQRVTLTAFGQASLFFLSELGVNSDSKIQTATTHAIIGLLGANILMYLSRLYDQGAVRVESHAVADAERPKLQKRLWCLNHKMTDMVKFGASIAVGTSYFIFNDPVLKAILSFGAFFWGAQIIGGQALRFIDRQIERDDSVRGTPFRALKTALNTMGFFAIPLAFVPWTANPHTAQRVAQLPVVGAITGFFDQIMFQSANERLKKVPIRDLHEFQVLNVPGKKELERGQRRWPPVRYIAYRIWEVAVPILSIGGLVYFTIWQEKDDLDGDQQDQLALGAMFGGFMATYGIYKWVDLTWNSEERRWLQDKLMSSLITGPRVLGINPVYIYFVGNSALAMSSDAVDAQEDNIQLGTIIAAWLGYGIAMGHELVQTSGTRRRPPFAWPMMLMLNGVNTMRFSLTDKGGPT